MIIKSVELEKVCGVTSVIPDNDKPEIAFAGKSNVGKSSLINALMNRKSLEKHKQLISIILIMNYIMLICPDMDMQVYQKKLRQNGES